MFSKIVGLAIIFLHFLVSANAQIQVTQLPSFGASYTTADVLNLAVVSQIAQPVTIEMEAVISTDRGEIIANIYSKPLVLRPGINQYNFQSIDNSKSVIHNQELVKFEKLYKSLPKGYYNVCVRIKCNDLECRKFFMDKEYKYCNVFLAQPFVSIFLISPKDADFIETTKPVLVWSAPVSENLMALSYSITLVEVIKDEAPNAAISANIPIIQINNYNLTVLPFPPQTTPLIAGKTYAWQVVAFNKDQTIASSEIWIFTPKDNVPIPESLSFVNLQQELSGSFVNVTNNQLGFQFNERFGSGNFKCMVYNDIGMVLDFSISEMSDSTFQVELHDLKKQKLNNGSIIQQFGDNKFLIDLSQSKLKKGFYILETSNSKNEKYYLRFKI